MRFSRDEKGVTWRTRLELMNGEHSALSFAEKTAAQKSPWLIRLRATALLSWLWICAFTYKLFVAVYCTNEYSLESFSSTCCFTAFYTVWMEVFAMPTKRKAVLGHQLSTCFRELFSGLKIIFDANKSSNIHHHSAPFLPSPSILTLGGTIPAARCSIEALITLQRHRQFNPMSQSNQRDRPDMDMYNL